VIKGTLHYISPEQTGRMNRTVDYRTDLYSLGITFYEMLTGTVPFESHDSLEVIHSHIARKPVPPVERNAAIPAVVSDIVMKLMSKNAEDRYQNAFGLLHDLNECAKGLAGGKIKSFDLARQDISNRFIIPQKLFGREKELTELISSFDRVCGSQQTDKPGTAGIMLVSGSPGVGKSALIHEIHKPITARRGYFISGKYEQFRRDKPYSGIIQALQQLISQILAESEEMIGVWKKNILDAVGNNGKIIINMIPMVEMIIGAQPDVPALPANEERNRFNIVFENFIGVFAKQEHPVALFLDDMQ
jgi:serine/threonine protein kinase